MAEPKNPKTDQPTQKTPQGHEIPVPTRKQVFRDLEKVAKSRPKRAKGTARGRGHG